MLCDRAPTECCFGRSNLNLRCLSAKVSECICYYALLIYLLQGPTYNIRFSLKLVDDRAMAKLCPQMCSVLTNSAIENLNQRKIFTVIDVLQENPAKLASISKLEFRDVIMLRQTLIANYAPFPRQGLDAYNELASDGACISSGIGQLDSLLGGGFMTGNVTELCGLSCAGKTQLCLSIATHVALELKSNVIYVDTKNDFSGKRIHSMLEARCLDEEIVGITMERLKVVRPHNFTELYSFMWSLKENLNREPGYVRLVLIDSLPAIFLQFMGSLKMDSLGLMNNFVSVIRYIAHEQHVSFLVVNLASKWLEGESAPLEDSEDSNATSAPVAEAKPTLGKYWIHIPNTRLYIEKNGSTEDRTITVMKSTHLPVGIKCSIHIKDEGVV